MGGSLFSGSSRPLSSPWGVVIFDLGHMVWWVFYVQGSCRGGWLRSVSHGVGAALHVLGHMRWGGYLCPRLSRSPFVSMWVGYACFGSDGVEGGGLCSGSRGVGAIYVLGHPIPFRLRGGWSFVFWVS